ncbi:GspH/FimT family pseudopilin [Microbulbifer yueqingensis]|uniref:Type II secretion system protein H n=1 Tax=Microbulbifer yueqingensis TaxID=658219 RepID=A0A1G9ARN6_9GAMM|nr:GspH/FimT family pseudopilin [Microbulbifer yueqingensis]SDK29280.1 prepilin-type N-terminal cleavage/methylation domain-containing protein [Microbulbifer yueqingensis]
MPRENLNKAMDPGFTLLELMITLSIASILLAMGVPSFRNFFDAQELKGASEQVYSHIKRARVEALSRKKKVGVNFTVDGAGGWAYGVSDANDGSCNTAQLVASQIDACTLVVDDGDGNVHDLGGAIDAEDKVLMLFRATEHDGIDMTLSDFTNGSRIVFEPVRGTAMESFGNPSTGRILLQSNGGRQLMVKVGLLGQVRICSPDGSMHGYADRAPADDTDC